jgi:hypothetical protein
MPQVNERVVYRSIAGDFWDVTILAVREWHDPIGLIQNVVDIRVLIPGRSEPIELPNICWRDDPDDTRPGARPRRDA